MNTTMLDSRWLIGANFIFICFVRLSFAGVYRKHIADYLPRSILIRILSPKWLSMAKTRKLHENIFYTLWHTVSFAVVLWHLLSEAWFFEMIAMREPRHIFSGWPHFVDKKVQSIYLMELSFWLSCVAFMAVETRRNDVWELLVHHVATITLVGLSYMYSYYRIGFVVMLIHDVGDIFLYAAKTFHYLKSQRLTNILFISFVIAFATFRLALFPFVVRTAWGPITGYMGIDTRMPGCYILPAMLSVLQLLHLMWFVLIIRMVYRMAAVQKNVEGDIRSDEEADEEGHSTSVKTE